MSTPNLNASGYQYSGYNPTSQPAYANQYQQYPYGNTTAHINASSASIASAVSNASKASKLSVLKNAFKRSNTAPPQPPPVPQKDPSYLQAIQNGAYSNAGGRPAEYGILPHAYSSNVSLTLSVASNSTRASAPGSNLTHKPSSAANFFKFGRKSKKARSPTPTVEVSGPRNVKVRTRTNFCICLYSCFGSWRVARTARSNHTSPRYLLQNNVPLHVRAVRRVLVPLHAKSRGSFILWPELVSSGLTPSSTCISDMPFDSMNFTSMMV
jgi:hypothetical protein